ncbi:unnamed protein product [Adineta steineri]|uniref:Uncharacterized protein n=1 Tax=Adineta steineri TaxID=433720 RepID=A0A820FM82_9BILA|nr:unnamed protein product [Adineta steineri]
MTKETIDHLATIFPINREALKSKSKHQRSVSILKEFSLNTSAHGIPSIARSHTIQNRLFWIVSSYFQYPTQTSVSFVTEWPQAFTAVTICNYSPIRYDRFIIPFLNYTNMVNLTNTNSFTMELSLYIHDFLLYKINRNESINDFFYSLDSMMMSCVYNRMTCTTANFTWFLSPVYGLCYTFNALLKNVGITGLKYNSDNGINGLLDLRLYAHQFIFNFVILKIHVMLKQQQKL